MKLNDDQKVQIFSAALNACISVEPKPGPGVPMSTMSAAQKAE